MRRSDVRDRRALFVDKILYFVLLVGVLIATALYLMKESVRERREK